MKTHKIDVTRNLKTVCGLTANLISDQKNYAMRFSETTCQKCWDKKEVYEKKRKRLNDRRRNKNRTRKARQKNSRN